MENAELKTRIQTLLCSKYSANPEIEIHSNYGYKTIEILMMISTSEQNVFKVLLSEMKDLVCGDLIMDYTILDYTDKGSICSISFNED